jgi:hypothetical protein
MPYIKQEDRKKFDKNLEELSNLINVDGELNYCVTILIHRLLKKRGKNYQNLNNLIGTLECIKQEFYRTTVSPYENLKILENGDVTINLNK